ncbi:MAG: hypothetical protein C4524_11870 [Candidatus Zixiibacteriota bacterium]|nr:MAG: hypothetical protein C4524_11870 [candidate division Zixibacteria bacterium]
MRQNRDSAPRTPRPLLSAGAVIGLLAGLWAAALAASAPEVPSAAAPPASSYQEQARRYFLDRSMSFAQELLLKEQYLGLLYESTTREMKARRGDGLDPALVKSPLWDVPPAHLEMQDSTLDASIAGRYRAWVDYERREYQRRLELILDLRSRLIAAGRPEQNERMFRRELKQALFAYGKSEWELARLLFDRLLEDYQFQGVDDILYYQGQVCLQLRLLDCALDYFTRLLTQCPASTYRALSYDQATALLQATGQGRVLRVLYGRYMEEGAPGDPAQMGGVHLRAARSEADLGHYEAAVNLLTRVDARSPHYLASRYLLADCLAALEDWPRAVHVLSEMVDLEQGDMPYDRWRMLVDEARIKLAFYYYEWGDYERAADLFAQVKSNSPFYDRSLLGKAWIAYQLDDYDEATAKSREMLKLYPRSTEIYEANSLAGYCFEQLGRNDEAMTHFLDVLEAGVGRSQLQSFLEERRRIAESLADLEALEEEVFASGDERMFSDYRRARDQLWVCKQRIGLAELLQVNARMKGLVEERVALDQVAARHARLEDSVSTSQNAELIADFLALEDRIYTAMEHLKAAGKEQLKSTPLYYKEAQVGYINARADSLAARLEGEIARLTTGAQDAEMYKQAALAREDGAEALELGLRRQRLDEALVDSHHGQTQARAARRPVLKTRVDRWSDFSFSRYAMGGMQLEELERKYERLRQVDEYITVLDEMIEQGREAAPPEGAEPPEQHP